MRTLLVLVVLGSACGGGSSAADLATSPADLTPAPPTYTSFAQGFFTNVLNPKVALFFLALLPQFIGADAPSKPLAFLFLGGLFVVNGTLFLCAVVLAANSARRIATGTRARRLLNSGGSVLFALLAARLAFAERA